MIKFYLTTVILSLAYWGTAYAQNIPDSSKTTATTTSSETQTAKVFGGLGQYRKFSIGINVGVTSPVIATGGRNNDFNSHSVSYGYGIYLKEQLAHSFALQLDVTGGKVKGKNDPAPTATGDYVSYDTRFWQASMSAVVNVATIDFIRRKNAVNFYLKGGAGMAFYDPKVTRAGADEFHFKNPTSDGSHYVKEFVIPVGAGVKFHLSDAVALDLGYTQTYVDADNFDGRNNVYPTKDHYSYAYAGLAFTVGSKSKPVLEWVNPVAMMYDELYDAALRQEVEALKGRIANVETAVNDLKKDSDGDGVSDQFDKCPDTPTGAVVDGSGCPFGFVADTLQALPVAATYANIQFEFDSSVLRTSSYPVLDATSADLRASGKAIQVDGFTSNDEGTAAHQMRLAKDRASSVKTYLVNSGVDPQKVKIKAFGESHPIASNSTEEGRILNRRVQFNIQAATSSPFPTRITFDPNQSVLKADMQSKLKVIVAYLTANPGAQIDLKGHCNAQEIPRTELNNDHNAPIKLSQARINSVFDYLISQHVTAGQIKSKIALGTASPLSGVNNYDRQFQNRSVEITKR